MATNEEIIEAVVEAYSLDREDACTPEEWRRRIDLDRARLWYEQCERSEVVLARYHRASRRARRLGNEWVARGWEISNQYDLVAEGRAAMQRDPRHRLLERLRYKAFRLANILNVLYGWEIDECGRLSRGMVDWPKFPRQAKTPPDPARLAAYWLRKVDRTEYHLKRAQGKLERLEKEAARPSGDDITTHFHLGQVGGSGKKVLQLNKKREQSIDRDLRRWRELRAARERVSLLQARLDRFVNFYQKWEEQINE